MKKIVVLFVAVFALGFAVNAQDAFGLRFGGGQGYGAELSYQQGLGGINRLEADLGYYSYGYAHYGLTVLYQAHFDIPAVQNLGWYAGIGGRVDMYTYSGSNFYIAAAVQAGIDYHFDALPIQLSLDIRPYYYITPSYARGFYWGDIALGVRYML